VAEKRQSTDAMYLKGQVKWWNEWAKAKRIQKLIYDAVNDAECAVVSDIIGQLERRIEYVETYEKPEVID
jgi:hypothetical protein